jgi:serine/threonine protein phosphatase PrpC
MHCPDCATEIPDEDIFCENCGRRLGEAVAASAAATLADGQSCGCGAGLDEVDEDGFCMRCGRRVRRPPTDHVEQALSPVFAAVSDRGVKHDRNEDRCGIVAAGGGYVMVVCDGVSATRKSETASEAVVAGTLKFLEAALQHGAIADPQTAMREAIAAGEAHLKASSVRDGGENPPSTTVVAALVAEGHATLGWVGDSRAYWIDASGAHPLTQDHSWLNFVMTSATGAPGEITLEQAEKAPQAHAITRWIGADAGEFSTPDVVHHSIDGPGMLLLCTDGLWNYAPTLEEMAETVEAAKAGTTDTLGIMRRLVEFAIGCGGHDNITVAALVYGNVEPAAGAERLTEG